MFHILSSSRWQEQNSGNHEGQQSRLPNEETVEFLGELLRLSKFGLHVHLTVPLHTTK